MDLKEYPKHIQWLYRLGFTALILLILSMINHLFGDLISRFFQALNSIVLPFAIALFISYLLAPLFGLLEKKMKQPSRLLNTVIVFGGVGVALYFFGRFAGTLIYEQGVKFVEEDWPVMVSAIEGFVAQYAFLQNFYDNILELISADAIGGNLDLFGVFESITSIIITIVLVPVFLFFILNDRTRIYESIIVLFPKKIRHHAIELLRRANRVIEEYFNGRFITMFVMAIVFSILFLILGFRERSVLFGFMLGFFDIIPYVGPFIAMLLPVLYSLTDDALLFGDYAPVAIAIAVIVGQMVQNNVAQPIIMGKETKLHPMLVLSSFVFFGYLFGVVGIILAIPITGMIRTSIHYVKELNKEKLSLDEKEKQQLRKDETQHEDSD